MAEMVYVNTLELPKLVEKVSIEVIGLIALIVNDLPNDTLKFEKNKYDQKLINQLLATEYLAEREDCYEFVNDLMRTSLDE